MKVRIRFTKGRAMQYISHLDVMRYFQKALRRAEVDMCYSQGFNPHQIMSFASPLGMGQTSEGEYMDIEVNTSESSDRMAARINQVMCPGIQVMSFVRLPDDKKTNAMASLSAAGYRITGDGAAGQLLTDSDAVGAFFLQDEIPVTRQTKSRELTEDIRPYIYSCRTEAEGLTLLLAAGSVHHLKPETVADAYFAYLGRDMQAEELLNQGLLHICRTDMFARGEEGFIPLDQLGEVIL